ncbi:MAG TPA: Crp/Fnr family transcriptional regulator [Nitrospirae bacterium]|nr:Crp/Fnr family transcriptional regulator [Nitrospirota bacterium]
MLKLLPTIMKNNLIFKISLFRGLDEENINKLVKICHIKKFDKGEVIFMDGDEAKGFYCINSGFVKIFKIGFDGKEQIFHLLGPGEVFGEVPVFIGGSYPANAVTLQDSTFLFIEKDDFIYLIKEQPQVSLNMIANLSLRLKNFTHLIENLSLKEVPSRLSSYLLYVSNEKNMTNIIRLDVSKTHLASILGTVPETLSRIFAKMTSQGLIEVNGKVITIKNQKKLEELASGLETLK